MKLSKLFIPIFGALFAYEAHLSCANWTILTTNFDDNTVSSFPLTSPLPTNSTLVNDPTHSFSQPLGVAFHPDGSTAYVANNAFDGPGGSISTIDIATNSVVNILTVFDAQIQGPYFISVNSSGTYLYLSNVTGSAIPVYDISGSHKQSPTSAGTFLTANPKAIAISHDDRTLYTLNNDITLQTFDLSANPIAPPLVSTIQLPPGVVYNYIALTPRSAPQQKLYVTNNATSTTGHVISYDLSDRLNPTNPVLISTGDNPDGIAINPAGTRVFVAHSHHSNNFVSVIDVRNDQFLFNFPVTGINTAPDVVSLRDLVVSPDNKTLFVLDQGINNGLYVVPLPVDGTAPIGPFPFIPLGKTPLGIAMTPDQAPHAAFTFSPANPSFGTTVSFDASASTTPVGTVASYHWNFGDGSVVTTASPTITHTFASTGILKVILTVTSTGGTSIEKIFPTGRDLSNNGSPTAETGQEILVNQANTTITINTSPNPSAAGQAVVLISHVSAVPPATGTPTGSVIFYDGSMVLGSAPVDVNGNAVLSVSTLAAGSHELTAHYQGSSLFNASTSAAVTQIVKIANSATSLNASPNPSRKGQRVTLTATVTGLPPGAITPTGEVSFFDGRRKLGSAPLNANGSATLSVSTFSSGKHFLSAVYEGDGNFNGSASRKEELVVKNRRTHLPYCSE